MKLGLGICFKCEAVIIKDRQPTSIWVQRGYTLKSGDIYILASCCNCSLEPHEYTEASQLHGLKDNPIVGIHNRDGKQLVDTLADILKAAQGSKCFECGKPIKDTYAISGGHITCERC
jgi:hypothetical protein